MFYGDGLHPNALGARIIAEIIVFNILDQQPEYFTQAKSLITLAMRATRSNMYWRKLFMADQELMPVEQTLPHNVFILPLVGNPIFPGLFTPLVIESREDIEIVNQAMTHGGDLGLLLVKDDTKVEYDPENLYRVGTIAKIIKRIKLPDGGMNIFISTLKRFQVKEFHNTGNFIVAEVDYLEDIEDNPQELKAWTRQLITEMKRLSKGNPVYGRDAAEYGEYRPGWENGRLHCQHHKCR